MSLDQYNKKRDFKQTKEPEGEKQKGHKQPIFVVQKHSASHLHYDFRLEYDGALVSWAIPKKPVMDPDVKRLAIHVEDHPLDYAKFEGTIPEGEYGAGKVEIWDKGTYELYNKTIPQGLKKGHVHVILKGEKLKGEFSLVKFDTENKNTWLFFKNIEDEKDIESTTQVNAPPGGGALKKGKPPRIVKPMLAKLVKEPFSNDEWLFELKYDGYRIIAHKGKTVRLQSRNGEDYTKKFPQIVKELEKIDKRLVLDGEVIVQDAQGVSKFGLLQDYLRTGKGQPVFVVFDILHADGFDLRGASLSERKQQLKKYLKESKHVIIAKYVDAKGEELYELSAKEKLEGIIAKRKASEYEAGKRSGAWQKIKNSNFKQAFIVGFTAPQKGRKHFGALLLAEQKGKKFKYIGRVGTGFSTEQQQQLRTLLKPLIVDSAPVELPKKPKEPVVWLRPQLQLEVSFAEVTKDGLLRHPSFQGMVEDESEDLITRKPDSMNFELGEKEVAFTNLSKVFWPEQGYTKGDVIEYYAKVSELILPYLKDRPQSLHRHPNGINEEGFYQKDLENHPDWVKTHKLHSKSAEKDIDYLIVNDAASLLYMAQLGCIEVNPWHSRVGSIDKPDYLIIDLDPHGVGFDAVLETAKMIRKVLKSAGIEPLCKTSGMKGLHIFVPLGAEYTYKQSLDFAKLVAGIVHDQLPEITSIERSPEKRKKHVYLDVYQNPRGQTITSAYSLRPFPGAPVSTPLKWSEVNSKLTPTKYHIKNIQQRLSKTKDIWTSVLGKGINMSSALDKLKEAYPESLTK